VPGRTTGGSILAFTDVHDYFEGRADWLACGLPREGEKAYERRALDLVVDDGHVRLDERVRQVRERVAASRYGYASS
jgi:hypothetical protein